MRKHFFDLNAVHKFRETARLNRLKEQEELAGLRTENEILREELAELRARMGIEERRLK